MAEQVLSQEEIDALLSAMSKGEVDLEADKKKASEAEPYDLTSQSVMLRDQFYALEEVHDKFSRLLQTSLSGNLQRTIDVEFVSTEMVKFGDFLKAFGNPTSFNIFNMDPLIGSALLAIEPGLVFCLIDCMFGGEGKPFNQVREFTLIEQRMVKKMALEVLISMEKAWKIIYPVSLTLKKTETKPEFVHLVNPNELVIVIAFAVKGSEFAGNIHFCISYLMLEPIKEKLCSRYLREKETEHAWRDHLQNLLRDTEVTLVAELGRAVHTVRDLLGLQTKDILKLSTGPQDPIRIRIEGIPKFKGFPGIVKGNRAVEIATLLRSTGGMNQDGY